ncbi:MAG: pyridoxal-phosphate dependent enzyme [Oscillospiraceae bacterium]
MEENIYPNYLCASPTVTAVRLHSMEKLYGLNCELIGAVLFEGATGSCMDKVCMGMLTLARRSGKLTEGMPIVEASHGTFGSALAIVARQLGHKVYLVMPETVEPDRVKALRFLGAEIVTTKALYGREHIEKRAADLAQELGGYYINYFANDDNVEYHRQVTGPELMKTLGGKLDVLVAGVGSGGTVSGVGEYIKAWTNNVKVVAVEPYESSVISGGFAGRHQIAGIGAGFVPQNYNNLIVDEVQTVTTGDALKTAQQLMKYEGLPAGPASGAAASVAIRLAALKENENKRIVMVLSSRQELD